MPAHRHHRIVQPLRPRDIAETLAIQAPLTSKAMKNTSFFVEDKRFQFKDDLHMRHSSVNRPSRDPRYFFST